jgi:outer membrane protein assembly factor BamE (lipoprotein component of BamABCDE complex)
MVAFAPVRRASASWAGHWREQAADASDMVRTRHTAAGAIFRNGTPDMDRPCRPVNIRRAQRLRGAALACGLLLSPLLLPGCSVFEAPMIQRGNRISPDQLGGIVPGVQTRQDVQALLGSPTQTSTFGDPVWYYISSVTRQRPGQQLAVSDQQTVVVEFDSAGVVQGVRTLGEDDTRQVAMVPRETPTPGNDRTLMQALFGNVGRVGPGAMMQTAPNAAGSGMGR